MRAKIWLFGAALLLLLALAACNSPSPALTPAVTQAPAATEAAEATEAPADVTEAPAATEAPVEAELEVPYREEWASSPHNDTEAEAFTHWNEEDPQEVPESCAKCHSTPGYQDYIGADGSEVNVVNSPHPVGTTVSCVACHNAVTAVKTSVLFPSGVEVTGLGDESRCMECHQGRASKVQVDETLERYGVTEDLDIVPEPVDDRSLGFINIHYYAAAATQYGTVTKGGYEYDGKSYDAKFDHVAGYNTCAGCHDPHTLELKVDQCAACHQGVASREDLRNIRMAGSLVDYDGDGDLEEGIAFEIEGLQAMLLQAIQAYATEKAEAGIVYDPATHPYFFTDTNANGQPDADEINGDNRFSNWTGRLVKAAYNYQTSLKDPGSFAHGGKYIIQLLYDSIEDLNTQLGTPVDLTAANRIDAGHFAGSEEAFRHWDADEAAGFMVPGDCAKCHSATGLPQFLGEASRARDGVTGVTVAQHPANGLNCATCHNDVSAFTRHPVEQVKFPSGAILALDNPDSNLCMECHQGRESKASLDRAINATELGDDDAASEEVRLSFRNPHYFATAATLMGTEAKGAYEFDGQQYNSRFVHVDAFNTCIECHDPHALTVNVQQCSACHGGEDVATYRNPAGDTTDYDGDGQTADQEGLAGEVSGMHEALFAALQGYAGTQEGTEPILYDAHRYPYFFADPNGNGELDEGEEGYTAWTPRLLRSAYNYQWVAKDPGAFAHNGKYILQILYDSIQNMNGDVASMVRPEAAAPAEGTPAP